jgi:tRNA dimethylallyltransferase
VVPSNLTKNLKARDRFILVVCGPTASRKTELSLELAEALDGEIVCCDSVQLYRGFRVGSAGPSDTELARVPHHLYGSVDPNDAFDAGRYARLADAVIQGIWERDKVAIVVGGAGLYLRALLWGLVDIPQVPIHIRERLALELKTDGNRKLFERLQQVDPKSASRIEGAGANTQRVLRALEVFEATGVPISRYQDEHSPTACRYNAALLTPTFETNVLAQRIDIRVNAMIDNGFEDEVRNLLESGVRHDCRPMAALGYRQLAGALLTKAPLEETVTAIQRAHRRYAKRQRTWFRKVDNVLAVDGTSQDLVNEALATLAAWVCSDG